MKEEEKIVRKINDLGACAYLLMHGFKVTNKKDKCYIFELNNSELKDFENKQVEYLSSDFHRFDSCLMSLKKLNFDHSY
jgi:hypothetical protein